MKGEITNTASTGYFLLTSLSWFSTSSWQKQTNKKEKKIVEYENICFAVHSCFHYQSFFHSAVASLQIMITFNEVFGFQTKEKSAGA